MPIPGTGKRMASNQQREIISGPAAWIGPLIQHDPSWIYHLDAADIAEIEAALAHVKRSGARIPFAADAFPLPRFAAALDRLLDEIENGRGFVLIRGIPRERYSDKEC
jgi:hypothetical protein